MLSILEKIPDLDREVILEIELVAPLSMVSDLPRSCLTSFKALPLLLINYTFIIKKKEEPNTR